MAKSAADLLKRAKSKGKTKTEEKTTSKKELRVIEAPKDLKPLVIELCELAYLTDTVKSPFDRRKTSLGQRFFDMWSQEMWDSKSKPDNFNVVVRGNDGMPDMQCQFQLRLQTKKIDKKLPKKMPKDATIEEVLADQLVKVVGMTVATAKKFVDKEVVIEESTNLPADFNTMLQEDSKYHQIGILLLTYMQARPEEDGGKTVVLEAFDDKLEELAITTIQKPVLKEDVGARLHLYCKSLKQLRELLKFTEAIPVVQNFQFGMSDTEPEKLERLKDAVAQYLVEDLDEDDE